MAKVIYDTHKIPTITLSWIDKEELDKTGYVQVDKNLFVMVTDEDLPRVVALKQVPYNCIKFTEQGQKSEIILQEGEVENAR